jgi:hypothetical protein
VYRVRVYTTGDHPEIGKFSSLHPTVRVRCAIVSPHMTHLWTNGIISKIKRERLTTQGEQGANTGPHTRVQERIEVQWREGEAQPKKGKKQNNGTTIHKVRGRST